MKTICILPFALCLFCFKTQSQNVGIGITPTAKLHINGTVKIQGSYMMEFGGDVPGKEINAGKIGYNIFSTNALTFVGAGNSVATRKVFFYAEGGTIFTGGIAASNNSSMTSLNLTGQLTTNATGANHMLPVCYGTVDGATASIVSGTGNFTVTRVGAGMYSISINGVVLTDNNYSAVVTCQRRSISNAAFFWTYAGVYPETPPTGSLYVLSSNGDQKFSFAVYKNN